MLPLHPPCSIIGAAAIMAAASATSPPLIPGPRLSDPFLIYCNSGGDHDALWHKAQAEVTRQAKLWPFDWVQGVDYPHKDQRATVTGKIVLDDPQAPGLKLKNLLVWPLSSRLCPCHHSARDRVVGGGRGGFGFGGGFGLAGEWR